MASDKDITADTLANLEKAVAEQAARPTLEAAVTPGVLDAWRPGLAVVLTAGAVLDAAGTQAVGDAAKEASNAVVWIQDGVVAYAGLATEAPAAMTQAIQSGTPQLDLGADVLLLPGMVNAHAHLELSAIGPVPYGGDFLDWVGVVMAQRPKTAGEQAMAWRAGLRLSAEAGVVAVGDIGHFVGMLDFDDSGDPSNAEGAGASGGSGGSGGSRESVGDALAAVPMGGVLFEEILGLSEARWRPSLEVALPWLKAGAEQRQALAGDGQTVCRPGFAHGLEAHAPYTTHRAAVRACVAALNAARDEVSKRGHASEQPNTKDKDAHFRGPGRGFRGLVVHLGELLEEAALVATGQGVFRERFEAMGFWPTGAAAVPEGFGEGASPVAWLAGAFEGGQSNGGDGHPGAGVLLAHGNYLSDADVDRLVAMQAALVYCPLASAYYGHPQGGHAKHRYAELMERGVPVALGTDSILCQPKDGPHALGLWPAMRWLRQNDGADAMALLQMATVHGAEVLGLPGPWGTLKPGAPGRLLAVQVPENACGGSAGVRLAAALDVRG